MSRAAGRPKPLAIEEFERIAMPEANIAVYTGDHVYEKPGNFRLIRIVPNESAADMRPHILSAYAKPSDDESEFELAANHWTAFKLGPLFIQCLPNGLDRVMNFRLNVDFIDGARRQLQPVLTIHRDFPLFEELLPFDFPNSAFKTPRTSMPLLSKDINLKANAIRSLLLKIGRNESVSPLELLVALHSFNAALENSHKSSAQPSAKAATAAPAHPAAHGGAGGGKAPSAAASSAPSAAAGKAVETEDQAFHRLLSRRIELYLDLDQKWMELRTEATLADARASCFIVNASNLLDCPTTPTSSTLEKAITQLCLDIVTLLETKGAHALTAHDTKELFIEFKGKVMNRVYEEVLANYQNLEQRLKAKYDLYSSGINALLSQAIILAKNNKLLPPKVEAKFSSLIGKAIQFMDKKEAAAFKADPELKLKIAELARLQSGDDAEEETASSARGPGR